MSDQSFVEAACGESTCPCLTCGDESCGAVGLVGVTNCSAYKPAAIVENPCADCADAECAAQGIGSCTTCDSYMPPTLKQSTAAPVEEWQWPYNEKNLNSMELAFVRRIERLERQMMEVKK